jgi:beta-lactam-binding protein with PASTA domain
MFATTFTGSVRGFLLKYTKRCCSRGLTMRIRGTVKNHIGAPLHGVEIIGTIADTRIFSTRSNELGDFDYRDHREKFARQRIRVCAEHPGYRPRYIEQTLPPGELRLEFKLSKVIAAPVIAGLVRPYGTQEPLAGARVAGSLRDSVLFRSMTDSDGRFRFQDIDPSLIGQTLTLTVEHSDHGCYEEQVRLTGSGALLEIELSSEILPQVTISGSVRARDTREPLQGPIVTASVAGGRMCRVGTDDHGRFRHVADPALVGETLTIHVEHTGFKRYEQSVRLASSGFTTDIELEREEVPISLETLDKLKTRASPILSINGSVRDLQSGEFLRGARLWGTVAGNPIFDMATDHDGQFNYQAERSQHTGEEIRVCAEHTGYGGQEKQQFVGTGDITFAFALSKEAVTPTLPGSGQALPGSNVDLVVRAEKQSRNWQKIVRFRGAAIALAMILTTVVYFNWPTQTVTVPSLKTYAIRDAERELSRLGLTRGSISKVHTPDQPPDTVIDTSPGPGLEVAHGSTVDLKVASTEPKPPQAEIPPLKHRLIHDAEQELSRVGLTKGSVSQVHTPDQPPDTVIETSPPAGQKVPRGSPVDLTVAIAEAKPPQVTIPPLKNYSLREAEQELQRLGLAKGSVADFYTPDQFPGTVIETSPPAGQKVPSGSRVDLTVTTAEPSR